MPIEEIRAMEKQLKKLGRKALQIKAVGEYPVKRKTKVAHVAVYQNDGTDKIEPSQFVERAAADADDWKDETATAMDDAIMGDGNKSLRKLGAEISKDIKAMCDRIDTGRLKKSFRGKVIESQ